MKLYELTSAYDQVFALIQEGEEDAYIDTLNAIEDEIGVKSENIVKLMKSIEAEEKAFKEESDRLGEKAKSLKKKRENLKTYLETCLKEAGIEKQKAGLFSLSIANNPPSVEVVDEDKVPAKYRIKQPDRFDKKSILADLKNGAVIDGVSLKQEKSLRIR